MKDEEKEINAIIEYTNKIPNNQELGYKSRQIINIDVKLLALVRNFPNDQDLGKEIRNIFREKK